MTEYICSQCEDPCKLTIGAPFEEMENAGKGPSAMERIEQLDRAYTEGRVSDIPYDPAFSVHTTWDLGQDDKTAIWFFQIKGHCIYWIDYMEDSDRGQGTRDDRCEQSARCPVCGEITHTAGCSMRFKEKVLDEVLELFEPVEVEP